MPALRPAPRCRASCVVGVVLPAVLACVVAGSVARADPAAVEDLIREGVDLRKKGMDQRALALFKKAYDLERSPRTATQLGFCEAQLGYWLAAERHLTEALSATKNPWLAKNEGLIRQTLKNVQGSIGELDIEGTPAGAAVEVNGQPAGTFPLTKPIRVPEGVAQVIVRAAGHIEGATNVPIEGGKLARASLALTPVAAAPTAAEAPEVAAPVSDRPRPRRSEGSPVLKNLAWAATVGSVAAAGLGFYGLHNQRKYGRQFDNYKDPATMTTPCYTAGKDKGGIECRNIEKKMKSAERLMLASFAAGGALAAGAIVGFILGSSSDEPAGDSGEVALSLQLGDGQSTPLGLGWTFAF
jgi:hypothetical protein